MIPGSLPQMATEWALTSASPAASDGTGTSVTRRSPKSNRTAAFMVLGMLITSSSQRAPGSWLEHNLNCLAAAGQIEAAGPFLERQNVRDELRGTNGPPLKEREHPFPTGEL